MIRVCWITVVRVKQVRETVEVSRESIHGLRPSWEMENKKWKLRNTSKRHLTVDWINAPHRMLIPINKPRKLLK